MLGATTHCRASCPFPVPFLTRPPPNTPASACFSGSQMSPANYDVTVYENGRAGPRIEISTTRNSGTRRAELRISEKTAWLSICFRVLDTNPIRLYLCPQVMGWVQDECPLISTDWVGIYQGSSLCFYSIGCALLPQTRPSLTPSPLCIWKGVGAFL